MKFSEMIGDALLRLDGLSSVGSAVQKDANGLPVAWPVLKFGNVSITKDGKKFEGVFSAEDADKIVAHFNQKGEKIPIDCNHLLADMAEKLGKTEAEIAKLTGENSLAAGFCKLEKRQDGLYASDAEWIQLAGELLKAGCFRHFSPVIRGLADGNMRITSLALLNSPAIDHQDAIAASAENGKGVQDGSLAAAFKQAFGLVDKPDAVAMGAIVALSEKMRGYDTMKADLDAMKLAAENGKKDALIKDGLTSGKLTNALLPWAQKVDCLTLTGFLDGATPVVSVGPGGLKPKKPDAVELSAEDKNACHLMGISEADMLATKKLKAV